MKKIIMLITICAIPITSFVGCSEQEKTNELKTKESKTVVSQEKEKLNEKITNKDGYSLNTKYNEESMYNVHGEKLEIDRDSLMGIDELGFGTKLTKELLEMDITQLPLGIVLPNGLSVEYVSDEFITKEQKLYADGADEEAINKLYETMEQYTCKVAMLAVINPNQEKGIFDLAEAKKLYSNVEKIAKNGDDTYYFCSNTEYPTTNFDESDIVKLDKIVGSFDRLKNNLMIFPKKEQSAFQGHLAEFKATDIDGKEVTQNIFENYDITMVNIWTTWCGYCVEEMPELQKLYENLPEKTNLISICGDGAEELELTKRILTESGVKFNTLLGNEELKKILLDNISSFPTTIFVDSFGNIIGDPILGAPGAGEDIVESYKNAINEALKSVRK